ncbi:hypothetical protein [Xanthomonas sp. CFBP 8445]|uniref:hypothetical protein n=1 Tax=Xanthomonas sp. CFBP 8445 TaxID=2971236 RepID=UPI0021DFABAE|nr:hypothetical protein [Xanthomonas sp. CFBP 8445]UYC11711.1 hypothetical protein NUG21_18475 [Xanthomonas sp. CFBP 8445]
MPLSTRIAGARRHARISEAIGSTDGGKPQRDDHCARRCRPTERLVQRTRLSDRNARSFHCQRGGSATTKEGY